MPNPLLRQLLVSRVADAVRQSREAALVDHHGLAGRIREIAVESLLMPLLPGDFQIGTGKITDCHGTQSKQIDVLIYSKRLLPPLLYDASLGIFPLESCFRAIEVKSTLTAAELRSSIASATQIATGFKYLPGQYNEHGRTVFHPSKKVGRALFAFGTDLVSSDELLRYTQLDPSEKPAIRIFCVVGSGCWLRTNSESWHHVPATADHDEVIEFLLACIGTLPTELLERKQPRLDAYLSLYTTVGPPDLGGTGPS